MLINNTLLSVILSAAKDLAFESFALTGNVKILRCAQNDRETQKSGKDKESKKNKQNGVIAILQ